MARPWRRRGRSTEIGEHTTYALTVAEAAAVRAQTAPPSRGYPADIPMGGTTRHNPGNAGQTDRRSFMDELYGAYLACPWVSRAVDVVAETVTAGGLDVVADTDATETDVKPRPTAEVKAVQALFDFVNPREDIRQLSRGAIQDEGIFGDFFCEVVWFAGRPVALYSLDAPSMIPLADEHGTLLGYTQQLDPNRTADFEPHEVIHVSLDSPRGSLYGVGPTQKGLIPTTAWLFTAGLLKETMRRGNPKDIHVDYPLEVSEPEIARQRAMYQVQNLGIANLGNPFITRGGATVQEMSVNQIAEYLATLAQQRDAILSAHGVPPAKVGVIESGNLGGGTGTSQDKTFRVNTCGPRGEAFLEKFTFHLLREAFGIEGWHAKFGEVDWRDDKTVEDIRDMRIRNASWTINRGRAEIGEPPVDGGDVPVLVDRQNMVVVSDLVDYSKAQVDALRAKGKTAAPEDEQDDKPPAKSAKAKPKAARESVTETASGVMVALYPPGDLAEDLAVDGGLDPADLHLTLAYLSTAAVDVDALDAVVRAWALATPPLELTVNGLGISTPTDSSDSRPVTYATVDCPVLPAARQRLVEMLTAAGLPVSTSHGFIPHVTLAYDDLIATAPRPSASFTADQVIVKVADRVQPFPLIGAPVESVDQAAFWQAQYSARRTAVLAELSESAPANLTEAVTTAVNQAVAPIRDELRAVADRPITVTLPPQPKVVRTIERDDDGRIARVTEE